LEQIKQLTKRSREYLFEIVLRRYETRSTMVTSNRPLEDWGKLLGDVPSATAILDRFLRYAEIISITGRSYRLKDRGEKDRNEKEPAPKGKAAGGRWRADRGPVRVAVPRLMRQIAPCALPDGVHRTLTSRPAR
jgi:hypothetical protein